MLSDQEEEVTVELLPFLRVRKDGTVERLYNPTLSPPSPSATTTGVCSKDTVISPNVSARIYLPNPASLHSKKLPILVYFHGGGFCIESAFSTHCHRYITTIASLANALIVSVDYRLAPENPLPAAYEDSWTALQWVASHANKEHNKKDEPWLVQHADFDRLYIDLHGRVKILGVFLSHPYFLGSKPLGSEPITGREMSLLYKTWIIAYPGAPDGIDNPRINPFAKTAACLTGLGCRRLMICVASEDELRDRGVRYYDAVKESGWQGEISLFEVQGEGHSFHIFNPETKNAMEMFTRLAGFLQEC
ncbi:hypothetical protein Ccrd_020042 [Cynara cardunculus var. scolymus]|uniref:Alpha/beta hydrolase fold-3 domain-containing protein n=1 Tax=Cynara cardunculus var. scolymus TaxID=59895 RepID=A0A103Y359_CYNCS|nr:hypothetical protein Ccrd_020042 [Cynara cardunculus var. scolymus]